MKRNTLTTAVLAGLTGIAGMASVSHAVNVNPDGLGQVLLYPYYTAREDNQTLVSIVNTTNRGKAVKIRFIEALNSREVLDFNIYLSPFDVWVASVAEVDGQPGIVIPDATCTVPYLQGGEVDDNGNPVPVFQEFLDFEYTDFSGSTTLDQNDDGGPQGIERTASGYIEVIEMGTLLDYQKLTAPVAADGDEAWIPYAVKHNQDGLPNACSALVAAWTRGGTPNPPTSFTSQWINNLDFGFDLEASAPHGGLSGAASIVNPFTGVQMSYNATSIDGFRLYNGSASTIHFEPGDTNPGLGSGNNPESLVFDNGQLVTLGWAGNPDGIPSGLAAVNAVLTKDAIINEYVTDPLQGAKTEWVITMPTKRFHADAAQPLVTANNPLPPFTDTWHVSSTTGLNLPCEIFEFVNPSTYPEWLETDGSRFWNREELPGISPAGTIPPVVSPSRPNPEVPGFTFELCREANVIRVASDDSVPDVSEIFGEPVRAGAFGPLSYTNVELPFNTGWIRLDLDDYPTTSGNAVRVSTVAPTADTTGVNVVTGLPVIGFAATSLLNTDFEGDVIANYGATYSHRGSRNFIRSGE